jgi:hypothetical protein
MDRTPVKPLFWDLCDLLNCTERMPHHPHPDITVMIVSVSPVSEREAAKP